MSDVLSTVGALPAVRELPNLLRANGKVDVIGTAGSGIAVVAACLEGEVHAGALALCPTMEEAEELAEDINLFREGLACHFPALEVLPGDAEEPSEAVLRARLAVLRHLAFGPAAAHAAVSDALAYLEPLPQSRIVTASVAALLQPTCSPQELRAGSLEVEVGREAAPEKLVEWLVDNGYYAAPQVEVPGQYCLRGGILDVFSHGAPQPVRLEFFADKVDSIRAFDPLTQLSTGRLTRCTLSVAEQPASPGGGPVASLLDYFPPQALVLIVEPDRVWERARTLYDQTEQRTLLTPPEVLRNKIEARPSISFHGLDSQAPEGAVRVDFSRRDVFGPDLDSMLAELGRICRDYEHVVVYCISAAEQERFESLLRDSQFPYAEKLRFGIGRLNHGALCPPASLALIPHHRLFARYRQRRFMPQVPASKPLESAEDLAPGDLVVHVNHGVGRFLGTAVIERNGARREYLEIEFADNVHVHVPCDRVELVHRYIGVGGRRPELSHIRSAAWWRARQRAQKAVEDLAAELLQVQALRQTQPGISFPTDTEWQRQFESEFPYEETEDQLRAIEDVKRDMRLPRPMDRLICGDVGYGKTEIAMRAAFAAVMAGKQAAVLVPTTVLAQQHFRTFSERMADYPIVIRMLSRFLTPQETQKVLEGMASGQVDIVIGTHRLLQDDVTFKDLGLVIIDEEQRFGVEHKEKLKKLRATVDVLTLTATPIPRTLHMALMGLREISALQTPPRDRQAIETRVCTFDPALLRHAILRELSREGQVFIIHNRVRTIEQFAQMVRELVPEARVAVAHGQMPEQQLAETMDRFRDGQIDVLVSTTIIENGLDIPNANTIILDRADLLGLAEMHQLRGRVGRYIHKAYAYFFAPADRPITPEAQSRLEILRRYSQLGAGFDIALRDLELRGAGNILGPAQSGHIAEIGYNLYCRLLAQAAARLKGETIRQPPDVNINIGLDALLPEDYVPSPKQRIEIYRQLNAATDLSDVRAVERALRDRFGPPPPEARSLLTEAELRILSARAGIASIHIEDGRLHFGVRDPQALAAHFNGARLRPRLIARDLAVLDAPMPHSDAQAVASFLKRLLAAASEGR